MGDPKKEKPIEEKSPPVEKTGVAEDPWEMLRRLAERGDRLMEKLEEIDGSAQMGFDAAALVHELSNILGGMLGHVQLAQMTGEREDILKCLDIVGKGLLRVRDLIANFKAISSKSRTFILVDVAAEISSAMKALGRDLGREGINWTLHGAGRPILSDPKSLRKAFLICASATALALPPRTVMEIELLGGPKEMTVTFAGPSKKKASDSSSVMAEELQYLKSLSLEFGGRVEELAPEEGFSGYRLILSQSM